jgi:BirA family biotin operon repressor/biotin-[acetyl-CoA-carboxylase] ligase
VCGILVEAATGLDRMDFLIVGVGLNVNVEEFPSFCKNATSLQKELGRKVRIVPLFWKLFEKIFSFYNVYKEKGFSAFRREWERYDYLKGKDVCVKVLNKVYKGKVIGVDEDGALLLDCQGRRECMLAGDVNVEKD